VNLLNITAWTGVGLQDTLMEADIRARMRPQDGPQCSQPSDQEKLKLCTLSISKPIRNTVKHYFCCIVFSRSWIVEIFLHFNLEFSQCSTSIYQTFDKQTEFSRVLILQFYPTHEIC